MPFKNRSDAGNQLAEALRDYENNKNAIVLAIPRGGVEVGSVVAEKLGLPLDIVVIKKIGFPGNEELALGAAGPGGYYINPLLAGEVRQSYIKNKVLELNKDIRERYLLFKLSGEMPRIAGRIVIIVDDGIATGATITMAADLIRKQSPKEIVIAVPVAPPDTINRLKQTADKVLCLETPDHFLAVGEFYGDFHQLSDEDVVCLLKRSAYVRGDSKKTIDIP